MAARDESVAAIAGRYAQGDRAERGRILAEFGVVTPGRRIYDEAVREALIVIWEANSCGPAAAGRHRG